MKLTGLYKFIENFGLSIIPFETTNESDETFYLALILREDDSDTEKIIDYLKKLLEE